MKPPQDPVLLAEWVKLISPQEVANWLEAMEPYSDPSESVWENILSRRDPLIDLAAAYFADDRYPLDVLWNREDLVLRRAILRNQKRTFWVLEGAGFTDWVEAADLEDLRLLVRNPNNGGSALRETLERKGAYSTLTEERWQQVAAWALENPYFHHRGEFEDGWDYHTFVCCLEATTDLLIKVPQDKDWAKRLAKALEKFESLKIRKTADSAGDEVENPEIQEGRTRRDFLEGLFQRWTLASDGKEDPWRPAWDAILRTTVASKFPFESKWMREHPDRWVRIGAAASTRFTQSIELRNFVEEEGFASMRWLRWNPYLHERGRTDLVREARSLVAKTALEGGDHNRPSGVELAWMEAAHVFYSHAPDSYFAWDESPRSDAFDDVFGEDSNVEDSVEGALSDLASVINSIRSEPQANPEANAESLYLGKMMMAAHRYNKDVWAAVLPHLSKLKSQVSLLMWILLGFVAGVVVTTLFTLAKKWGL